jgi:hypothetical protein
MVELEAFVSLPTANNIKDGPTCGAVSFSAPLTKAGSHVCPVPIADLASVTRALRLPAAGVASGHSPRKKPCPLCPQKRHWVLSFPLRANGRHRFDHIVGASWPAFCSATEGSRALDFMEDKLALLYLIFMLIITIAYVEVSPTKHAQPTPIVTRIQAASE